MGGVSARCGIALCCAPLHLSFALFAQLSDCAFSHRRRVSPPCSSSTACYCSTRWSTGSHPRYARKSSREREKTGRRVVEGNTHHPVRYHRMVMERREYPEAHAKHGEIDYFDGAGKQVRR
eukprot:1568133-Prymnesium_polylepis.1